VSALSRSGSAASHFLGLRVRIPIGGTDVCLARVVCCDVEFLRRADH
jgi:hypothetical protein